MELLGKNESECLALIEEQVTNRKERPWVVRIWHNDDWPFDAVEEAMGHANYMISTTTAPHGMLLDATDFFLDPELLASMTWRESIPTIFAELEREGVPIGWSLGGMSAGLEVPGPFATEFLAEYKSRIDKAIGKTEGFSFEWDDPVAPKRDE